MLGEVRDLLSEKNVSLSWEDSLIDYLVRKGYSVTYGARNLRRLIQKEIEDRLAAEMIARRGTPIASVSLSASESGVQIVCGE